jgi:hypothetical protein
MSSSLQTAHSLMSKSMKSGDDIKDTWRAIIKSKSGGGDPLTLARDAIVEFGLKAMFPNPKAENSKKKTDDEKEEEKKVKKMREEHREKLVASATKKYPTLESLSKLEGDEKKAVEKASLDVALKDATIALINEIAFELTGKKATVAAIAAAAGGRKATRKTVEDMFFDILDGSCRPFDTLIASMKSPEKSSSGGKKVSAKGDIFTSKLQKGELKDEDGETVDPILDADGKPLVWAKWTKTLEDATKVLAKMKPGKKLTDEQTRAQRIVLADILLDEMVKKTKSSGGKPASSKVSSLDDDDDADVPAKPESAKPESAKPEPVKQTQTQNASDDEDDDTLASDDESE